MCWGEKWEERRREKKRKGWEEEEKRERQEDQQTKEWADVSYELHFEKGALKL